MKTFDPYGISLDKTVLIEASAGTGKTYTITTLYCRLIAEGYLAENILVVTFTEAAAAELKLRIRSRLSAAFKSLTSGQSGSDDDLIDFFKKSRQQQLVTQRLSLALNSFDQAGIYTIHSFCLKVLQENAFYCKFPFEVDLVADHKDYVYRSCMDFFALHVNPQDPLFLKFLDVKNITPENFSSSFTGILSRQDLEIKPESIAVEPDYAGYRSVLHRLRAVLSSQLTEIVSILSEDKGINKRSYSKRNVPLWLEACLKKFSTEGEDAFFVMEENKDPLYRFTIDELTRKTKDGHTTPSHEFFSLCQQVQDFYRELEWDLVKLKHRFFLFMTQALESAKNSEGICFFDDLVNRLCDVLDTSSAGALIEAVNKTFKACLIDEFQDTDPAQYKIFSHLFENPGTPFFMIGDPKQAIYAFRGGDIFAYLQAGKNADERYTLKKNYRSAPKMVSSVNTIFAQQPDPFLFKEIEFTEIGTPDSSEDRLKKDKNTSAPFEFIFLKREGENTGKDGYISKKSAGFIIPDLIANDIRSLVDSEYRLCEQSMMSEKKIEPHDIAVLVRTNEQAALIQDALNRLGITAYLAKSGSVFDSSEAIELYDILNSVYEPDNQGFIKSALCTGVFGYTVEQVHALWSDADQVYFWQKKFLDYKKIWEVKGFVSMIFSLFHSDGAFLNSHSCLTERELTNHYHLVELVSQAETLHHLSPFYLMRWYARQLTAETREESASEIRLESDKKAVAIVTVHKSKGLEYPVVYLPYLWENPAGRFSRDILFHDPDNEYNLTLDIGSQDFDQSKQAALFEEQAEHRRLLYVALTRASAMCRILWGGIKNVESSALGSMLHPTGCHSDKIMIEDLNALCSTSGQCISLETVDYSNLEKSEPLHDVDSNDAELSAKTSTADTLPDWTITSFSSIVRNSEVPAFLPHPEPAANENDRKIILLDFYKGARAGDAFHQIFEQIDFSSNFDTIEKTAHTVFEKYGFNDINLKKSGINSLKHVLETQLETGKNRGFCLKDIDTQQVMKELEFIFPAGNINSRIFQKSLTYLSSKLESEEYVRSVGSLDTTYLKGFIKGFIDLVICHKNRWYILDYKTNFLGDTYMAYNSQNICNAMAQHHYFIQYHIYLAALHRYLTCRLKTYEYNTHFGGVFYLFIRGMHPDFGSKFGVYFDRPPQKTVECLSNNLQ